MALNWKWKDKIGYYIARDEKNKRNYKINLYACNGLFVGLFEYKENNEDFYIMHTFAIDKEHFKRLLGTARGYEKKENCFNNVIKWHFIKKEKSFNNEVIDKIIKELIKTDCKVEIKTRGVK